ncbi:hypothetical protein CRE_10549 [Caenorhabditis remanei]|uniref:F-box domain-containing protein n=1 Tax=Caenorhabditis remanei TaxID=31234 RepID=E3N774_CAERE|nr:hypothetical protein CRE_10549 [Caenorhabditis remanei]
MSSEFPLFLLPMLVLNRVLKLVTPFELVAISLCSKKSKMLCKSARSQKECKYGTNNFLLNFSSNKEIRLKFDYHMEIQWVFKIEWASKRNQILPRKSVLNRILSIFRKTPQEINTTTFSQLGTNFIVPVWIPTEDTSEVSLKLYTSRDSGYDDVNTFILYLSDVFNVRLVNFELHYQDFNREDNEKIVDFYCRNSENKKSVPSLSLFTDFKLLIEKWNSGWTPKWRVIMVESSEEVNIDECVSELVALGRFSEVQVERSEVKDEFSDGGVSERITYKIHRSDKAVGQIIVENSSMFWLYVKIDSEKNSRFYPPSFLS